MQKGLPSQSFNNEVREWKEAQINYMNKVIKVMKITYDSLCKLLELGYTVVVHNPEANKKHPPKKIPYQPEKRPTFVRVGRQDRIKRLYRDAFIKGKLK